MTWVPKRTVHTTKKENIYMATRILKPNLSSAFKRIVKLFNSIFFVTKEARYSISGFLGSTTLEFRNPSIIKVPKKFSTLPRSCWYYKFRGKKVTHPFEARRETLTHSRWYGSIGKVLDGVSPTKFARVCELGEKSGAGGKEGGEGAEGMKRRY